MRPKNEKKNNTPGTCPGPRIIGAAGNVVGGRNVPFIRMAVRSKGWKKAHASKEGLME